MKVSWTNFKSKYVPKLTTREPFDLNFGPEPPVSFNKLKKNSSDQKLYRSIRQLIIKAAGGEDKLKSFIPFLFPEMMSSNK